MQSANAKFLVTFVRHGETFMNSERLVQGHTDSALSEIGIEQAKVLGRAITGTLFTRAYSSGLQRAYNTAKIILNELNTPCPDVVKHANLLERSSGDAEGKPAQEFIEKAAKAGININDYTPNGGETVEELTKRVAAFFEELCQLSETTTSNENVLVVSHGGWIIGLMRYLDSARNKYKLKNFTPSSAIQLHCNTAITIMEIIPLPNVSGKPKYQVNILK